mmetsp:Transcript_20297/g.26337  ORF Transcript_20297/g.26337 Transcript_20297/m.26337 type:complete len:371 (+) Transcript_20297:174-1286(+)
MSGGISRELNSQAPSCSSFDMEKSFFKLHSKLVKSVTYFFSDGKLKFFEYCLLFNAVGTLLLCIYLHSLVVSPTSIESANCISNSVRLTLHQYKEEHSSLPDIVRMQVDGIWKRLADDDVQFLEKVAKLKETSLGENKYNTEQLAPELLEVWLQDPTYTFAFERGYLLLNETARKAHGVTELVFHLDSECFSSSTLTFFLDNFIGYDTILLNSCIDYFGNKGFLQSTLSRKTFSLKNIEGMSPISNNARGKDRVLGIFFVGFKRIKLVLATFSLIFVTTSLAHETFCASQEHVQRFALGLRKRVENNLPYYIAITAHAIGSLVFIPILLGMVVLLAAFFDDQVLSLMVRFENKLCLRSSKDMFRSWRWLF